MKIRHGFVSNSSSSSFCIIGVDGDGWIARLAKAEDKPYFKDEEAQGRGCDHPLVEDASYCPECGNDMWVENDEEVEYWEIDPEGKVVDFILGEEGPVYAGKDAEEMLKTMTIPEARESLKNEIKEKFDIDIPLEEIQFHYGEISTG